MDEIRETLSLVFLFISALVFLFLSVLLATRDGVLIVGDSGPFEIIIAVLAVGFIALGIDGLVGHLRGKR